MCSIPANVLLSLKSPSHLFSQIHCTVISSPPSIAVALLSSPVALSSPPPPFCAACRWHRGMQIGTECKESDLNTHFCSTVCHERLSYPIRSTTLLVAFTLLAYHHPCSYCLLISIIYSHSVRFSARLSSLLFSSFSHTYTFIFFTTFIFRLSLSFSPLHHFLLPCTLLFSHVLHSPFHASQQIIPLSLRRCVFITLCLFYTWTAGEEVGIGRMRVD